MRLTGVVEDVDSGLPRGESRRLDSDLDRARTCGLTSPEVGSLPFEVRRYLIQFLLVVALGAVVTFLIDYIKTRAERREQERPYRTSTLTSLLERLDSIYRRVKQTRQRLGIRPGHRPDNVDEMWGLREEGEDLEQLAKDIEVHQRIFRGLNLVLEHVKAMDRYLGGIWKEYRTEFQDAQGSYGSFGERLRMFVESSGTRKSDFPNFSVDYHEARRVLLELLIPTAAAHRADKAAIYDASQRTGASK